MSRQIIISEQDYSLLLWALGWASGLKRDKAFSEAKAGRTEPAGAALQTAIACSDLVDKLKAE